MLKISPPVMTIDQVAEYLHLHPLTVRRLARDGDIPAIKIGRQWRVKRDLLDRWLAQEAMKSVGLSFAGEFSLDPTGNRIENGEQ